MRRIVLEYLAEHGPTASSDELAAAVTTRSQTYESRRSVLLHLHHLHLPKLAEYDVIEYDLVTRRATAGPDVRQLTNWQSVCQ